MVGKNALTRRPALTGLAALVLGGGVYLLATRSPAEPEPATVMGTSADTGSAPSKACALRFRTAPDTRVLVFPTQVGLGEYIKAAAVADIDASRAVRDAHGAFSVEPGTPCELLERSAEKAKVKILEGESRGQVAWTTLETTGM